MNSAVKTSKICHQIATGYTAGMSIAIWRSSDTSGPTSSTFTYFKKR